jgi:hypothetical protein
MAVLRNVPVKWAKVHQPNTSFEPHSWEIVAVLTKEQADALQKEAKDLSPKGIKFKEVEGNIEFRFRRKTERSDGNGGTTKNSPPVVVGPKGPGDLFDKLIGNGSICNIQYSFSAYENKFGKGVTTDLKGVQVLTHVPYGVADGAEFGEEAVEENTTTNNDSFNDEDFS